MHQTPLPILPDTTLASSRELLSRAALTIDILVLRPFLKLAISYMVHVKFLVCPL